MGVRAYREGVGQYDQNALCVWMNFSKKLVNILYILKNSDVAQ